MKSAAESDVVSRYRQRLWHLRNTEYVKVSAELEIPFDRRRVARGPRYLVASLQPRRFYLSNSVVRPAAKDYHYRLAAFNFANDRLTQYLKLALNEHGE